MDMSWDLIIPVVLCVFMGGALIALTRSMRLQREGVARQKGLVKAGMEQMAESERRAAEATQLAKEQMETMKAVLSELREIKTSLAAIAGIVNQQGR